MSVPAYDPIGTSEEGARRFRAGLRLVAAGLGGMILLAIVQTAFYPLAANLLSSFGAEIDVFKIVGLIFAGLGTVADLMVAAGAFWMSGGGISERARAVARVAAMGFLLMAAAPLAFSGLREAQSEGQDMTMAFDAVMVVTRIIGMMTMLGLAWACDLGQGLARTRWGMLGAIAVINLLGLAGALSFRALIEGEHYQWLGMMGLLQTGLWILGVAVVLMGAVLPALKDGPYVGERAAQESTVDGGTRLAGLGNIIFGLIFIGGGLSGHLVLRGTNSNMGIVVVGGLLVGAGLVRMALANRR